MEKKPFVTKSQVEEIVKTYPTPFHLYDEKAFVRMQKSKGSFCMESGIPRVFCSESNPKPIYFKNFTGI